MFTVRDLTDSQYASYLNDHFNAFCLFYILKTTSLRKMAWFLTNEQYFVGKSLHQHPPSCDSILVFKEIFHFEQKRELDEIEI